MKSKELTKKQKEELEKFGANTWFVESLHNLYITNPSELPENWRKFFDGESEKPPIENNKESKKNVTNIFTIPEMPKPLENEEVKQISGGAVRIIENMNNSLTIPTAASQRVIPVKLLEENRIIINKYHESINGKKISFTHIIGWAIVKAANKIPAINNAYTTINDKPHLIVKDEVNLGIAIDIEKKDGTRTLIVPNIKKANKISFIAFVERFDELVSKARKGQIDPDDFIGTSLTLTNPGTIGTVSSNPRLMVGQGAIIATGAIQFPAAYHAMSPSTISILGISKEMGITSTYDHRIIQGAESGLFLKTIHELILGKDNFYEEIFNDLKIPLKPAVWETDFQPGAFTDRSNTEEIEKQARVLQLINMYRVRGHLNARLDPIGSKIPYHPELDPATYKLTIWDLDREFITGGLSGLKTASLRKILDTLQKTYCDKIGAEYMHSQHINEKSWLQDMMESVLNKPGFRNDVKIQLLKKLIEAEFLEQYLHKKFIGSKRFSVEGSETVIPVIDFLLNEAVEDNIEEVVFGMAHRGRINVLVNIFGKEIESILYKFEGDIDPNSIQGSGDVKYHIGATGEYRTRNDKKIAVSLASNPSHLEWVNPVVEGIVRAKQTRKGDIKRNRIIPVLIHGDAAFAGQGVVAETLNLSQLKGYRTGGTVHIIINNQIGFTTTPEDARSTVYATDVAKMVQAPIFHVNGDDPEAALWVTKIALAYRQKFNKDVVIDLFGYRRHGHNEGDEPSFTQPILYQKIKEHPSVRKIYSQFLLDSNVISPSMLQEIENEYEGILNFAYENVQRKKISLSPDMPLAVSKEKVESTKSVKDTSISLDMLKSIVKGITSIPYGFTINPKLKKNIEKRNMLIEENQLIDWAFAESIAFGSLLLESTPVRLSGQDSVRGTFSQRHLALTDINTGDEFLSLNHISNDQAKIEALDSFLSEAAVLGFEYGYSTADPLALVLWEAQFGDFANSAQVIIDNFIVASYEKWRVPNSTVLLLPHGFEGQGPEHSSARLERFLILCAQDNMEICNCTTPAQYFHLLRRHIKSAIRRPLVIMTPKSLLRHSEARSGIEDFTKGSFQEVINDNAIKNKSNVKRIIISSGKVYYELNHYRKENNINDAALIRLEQFYPYPGKIIEKILAAYPKSKNIVWVQEEPKNMGAWGFLSWRLQKHLSDKQTLHYSGRESSASPAVGSQKISQKQQEKLIKDAFDL